MADLTPPKKPDLYIVARMLERLWREEEGMLRTRLQTAAGVNYDVFRKYLAWLSDRSLIEMRDTDDGHEKILLTPRGQEAYLKLVQWINEVIHDRPPSS